MSQQLTAAVRQQIDQSPVSLQQLLVFLLAFLLNMVDGFDVVAMSVSMPALTDSWQLTATEKGYILSSALVGMTMGAMWLAPMADKLGRRRLMLAATLLVALSMLATGLIPPSVELMVLARIISGVGIGVIFANSATIGTEFAPEKYRNLAVTLIVMGYPFGAMIVGPVANIVLPLQGWQMLFIYGGIFTLLMAVALYLWLPESVEFLASKKAQSPQTLQQINSVLMRMRCQPLTLLPTTELQQQHRHSVRDLFSPGFGLATLGIWLVYFMGFLSLYFLMSWIPTLFVQSGFAREQGIDALTLYNLGAVVGILAIGMMTTHLGLAKTISGFFCGSALLLWGIAKVNVADLLWLNSLIFMIGLLLQGGFTAMYALTARFYPTRYRATGLGWAAGLGRVGAILAPIMAGYLVQAGWAMPDLFLLFAVPMGLAAAIIYWFRL